jgi:hypothetical protein
VLHARLGVRLDLEATVNDSLLDVRPTSNVAEVRPKCTALDALDVKGRQASCVLVGQGFVRSHAPFHARPNILFHGIKLFPRIAQIRAASHSPAWNAGHRESICSVREHEHRSARYQIHFLHKHCFQNLNFNV